MNNEKKTGVVLMVLAAVCFSLGGLLIKFIPWNPFAINGTRNVVACLVIGAYILLTKHRLKFNFTVLMGAVCMFGVTTLFTVANKMTTAGNAIILQYTAPVWIIILMYLFFKKRPDKLECVTIFVAISGILCFFLDSLSAGNMIGNMIAVISGIFYAGVFMLNAFEKGDALSSMFFGQLFSAVLLGYRVVNETDFSLRTIMAILILGAVQVGLAYIFFSYGTKLTDPVTASIIGAIEPILNPTLVAVFYGEHLSGFSIVGAIIVCTAVLYYNIGKNRQMQNAARKIN